MCFLYKKLLYLIISLIVHKSMILILAKSIESEQYLLATFKHANEPIFKVTSDILQYESLPQQQWQTFNIKGHYEKPHQQWIPTLSYTPKPLASSTSQYVPDILLQMYLKRNEALKEEFIHPNLPLNVLKRKQIDSNVFSSDFSTLKPLPLSHTSKGLHTRFQSTPLIKNANYQIQNINDHIDFHDYENKHFKKSYG